MTEQLSIAEALQELKLIVRKLDSRMLNITKYCSKRRGSKDEIENQKDFVAENYQSAKDLITKYKNIKTGIQKANLENGFEFDGKYYTVAEALLYKQGVELMYNRLFDSFRTINAMNQIREHSRLIGVGAVGDEQKEVLDLVPEVYYDEKKLQKEKEHLLELMSKINALIDKTNHSVVITV